MVKAVEDFLVTMCSRTYPNIMYLTSKTFPVREITCHRNLSTENTHDIPHIHNQNKYRRNRGTVYAQTRNLVQWSRCVNSLHSCHINYGFSPVLIKPRHWKIWWHWSERFPVAWDRWCWRHGIGILSAPCRFSDGHTSRPRYASTSLSMTFMMSEVSAMGLQPFIAVGCLVLGPGARHIVFHSTGTHK